MQSAAVVPSFDVVCDFAPCFVDRVEGAIGALSLQSSEETFHHCVVVAAAGAAHAWLYASVGIDLDRRRLDLAQRVAADEVLVSDDSLQDKLRAKLGADGADVVIELTGAPAAVAPAFQLAAQRGRVVLAGSTRGLSGEVNFYRDVHKKGLLVIGAHESARPQQENSPGYWTPLREYALCLDLMARGRVQIAPLITHRYNWREFQTAYAQLANWDRSALGMIIEWD